MTRDRTIVAAVIASISAALLASSALVSWAIAQGTSSSWRLPFRLVCHGLAERSLVLAGTPMPLCARCVGIYAGLLAGLLLFALVPTVAERTMRVIALAAVTPLAIDGFTQLFGLRESTNPLRLATGIAAGLAFGMWVLSAIETRRERTVRTS